MPVWSGWREGGCRLQRGKAGDGNIIEIFAVGVGKGRKIMQRVLSGSLVC
jgi:hypothetical protein